MKQEINSEVKDGVAGRDIVAHNERSTINVNFGENHGGQQIVANSQLHIHLPPLAPRPRIKVVIQPGPECISDAQKAKLKELVSEIVRLEALVRRKPRSFSSVWLGVNAKAKVTSYHLITQANYPKAEKFLREWIGRLSSAKSAHIKDINWRNRKFIYIFTNVKHLGANTLLRAHLLNRYGSDSMKELSDDDLDAVYGLVAGWKKMGHAPGQTRV